MIAKGLLICLVFAVCAFCEINTNDGIYNVTDANFEEFVEMAQKMKASFYLKFYSTMCGHCKEVKPIYIEAAKALKGDPDGTYILGEVNTMFQKKLTQHFDVRGLPTFLIFTPQNDYSPVQFSRNRTVIDFVTEIEIASGLLMKELEKPEELEFRLARRSETVMFGIFKDKNHPLFKEMESVKDDLEFIKMYYRNIKNKYI